MYQEPSTWDLTWQPALPLIWYLQLIVIIPPHGIYSATVPTQSPSNVLELKTCSFKKLGLEANNKGKRPPPQTSFSTAVFRCISNDYYTTWYIFQELQIQISVCRTTLTWAVSFIPYNQSNQSSFSMYQTIIRARRPCSLHEGFIFQTSFSQLTYRWPAELDRIFTTKTTFISTRQWMKSIFVWAIWYTV